MRRILIMKVWISRVLIIILCVSLIQPVVGRAEETIELNKTISGEISSSQKSNLYKVVLPNRGYLRIALKSKIRSVAYELRDAQENEIEDGWFSSESSIPRTLSLGANLEKGTYYFEVQQDGRYEGSFEISTTFKEVNSNDQEPNNSTEEAQLLILGGKVKGFLSRQDKFDVYAVHLKKAGNLGLTWMSFVKGSSEIELTNDAGEQILSNANYNSSYETNKIYTRRVDLEAGTYYIRVQRSSSYDTGVYSLSTTFKAANNQEREPNNGTSQAMALPFYKTLNGFLSWSDTKDFYKFTLPKASEVKVDVNSFVTSSAKIVLYDHDQKSLSEKQLINSSENPTRYVNTFKLPAGTYYLSMNQNRLSSGKYSLRLQSSHLLPPLSIRAMSRKSTSLKGKTEKYATVKIKIGKKTYTRKADSKGNYSMKVGKQRAGSKIYVIAQNKYGSTSKHVVVKK